METKYKKIIVPTYPHADTIVAIFLLKKLGKAKYPGIEEAQVEMHNILPESPEILSKKGYLLLDIGGGELDHHDTDKHVSQIIAEDLGIEKDPALIKLLSYTKRDDIYGKGTISDDPIDRAFGLSGLIVNVNRSFPDNPQKVVDIILPLIEAHYEEENKRTKELPKEFEKLQKEKKAETFELKQGKKKLKIIMLLSDNPSLPGWLKSSPGLKADVVVQKRSTDHINIMTRPLKRIDLRILTALLRMKEIKKKDPSSKLNFYELIKPGRISVAPEWYFDPKTNSILNGGMNPQGTSPTKISWEEIKDAIEQTLSTTFKEFVEGK
jgi:hypothetical protein